MAALRPAMPCRTTIATMHRWPEKAGEPLPAAGTRTSNLWRKSGCPKSMCAFAARCADSIFHLAPTAICAKAATYANEMKAAGVGIPLAPIACGRRTLSGVRRGKRPCASTSSSLPPCAATLTAQCMEFLSSGLGRGGYHRGPDPAAQSAGRRGQSRLCQCARPV